MITRVSTFSSQRTGFEPQYHIIQVQRYMPVITNMGPGGRRSEFQGRPQQHSELKGKLNYVKQCF